MKSPLPTLAISQESSFIAEKTFIELIPKHYVEQLSQNECLKDKWDLTNYSQQVASQSYINECEQLKAYLSNYNKKINGFTVKYIKAKHKWGRVFPTRSLGITSFAKKTRNTLIKDLYYDFDLKNCQPEILRCICEANHIQCDIITKYCNEREQIIEDIIVASDRKVNRDLIKSLIIRLSFYGGFDGWLKENNIEDFPEPVIVKKYRIQVAIIAEKLKQENMKLFKIAEKNKKEKGETNVMGAFLSTYLQEYELRIVENVLKYLCSDTSICASDIPNFFIATYEFDGLKLLKERVDAFGGIDKVLELINRLNNDLGFNILWEVKPITKFYNIIFTEPAKEINKKIEEVTNQVEQINECNRLYENMKKEWELTRCKIIKTGTYCELINNQYNMRKKQQLIDAYEHLIYHSFENEKGEIVNLYFIQKWIKDPTIKTYNDVGVFPNANKCPENILNLWTPFEMEKYKDEYESDTDGLKFILKHLEILCDNDKITYDYFLLWVAQMIQHPEFKSTCPILIGQEGGGKGTFMELMKVLLGSVKVLITARPEKYVWGDFNTLMANAFLVGLDEMNKTVTTNAVEFIKNLITDSEMTINDKGHSAYTINSYHHFMMMTNKDDGGIVTGKGDRRKLMIRISDELVGNLEYFNKFYAYLKNVNTMRTVYDYFKNMKDVPEILPPPPSTEYQDNLKLLTEDPVQRWLKDFVTNCLNNKKELLEVSEYDTDCIYYVEGDDLFCEMMGSDTFKLFCKWRDENQEKYETTPLKLGVNITNKRYSGITKGKHTNKGHYKKYNLNALGKVLGVGCLIDLKVTSDE